MPLREEVLNATMARLLDQYEDIRVLAEQRTGPEAIDITVKHRDPNNVSSIVIEAKIGTTATAKRNAVKQVRERLATRSKALAFALCYPTELKQDRFAQELEDEMTKAKLTFAPVTRVDGPIIWREGTVDDLADVLRHSDVAQRGVADAIEHAVREAAKHFQTEGHLFAKNFSPKLAAALALPSKSEKEKIAAVLIASLMLSNAALLHHRLRLVTPLASVPTLQVLSEQAHDKFLESLASAWETVLQIDYHPVFAPALSALKALIQDETEAVRLLADKAVRILAENALMYADDLAALRFDHAGPLYHRLLASAKYDGSFYTNNVSALLLARLALPKDSREWSDADALAKLKIIDPACGTGTLLMAAMHTIRDMHTRAVDRPETDMLHLALVEDMLYGLDINRHGVQLAACNLTLGNPRVDYSRMNLFTMRHGPQSNGETKVGSLEFLATARYDDAGDLGRMILPLPTIYGIAAERVEKGAEPDESLAGTFDLVIMNPPFTRNDIRNKQYAPNARRRVQQRECDIAELVRSRESAAGEAIDQTSIRTFFSPLADRLLKDADATLATVLPTTALAGASGISERQFLADQFQIETIITSHDHQQINFSENTKIHESLFIARRSNLERKPTRFISLSRMPQDVHEAMLLADLINTGESLDGWGIEYKWPWERVRAGDWQVALFYDGTLAEAYYDLAALNGTRLRITSDSFIGSAGRRIRDAFHSPRRPSATAPWKMPVLWYHKTSVHTTMTAEPDAIVTPKQGKEAYAQYLKTGASRLLIANKLRTNTVRTASCYTTEPVLGSAWIPIHLPQNRPEYGPALCVWWNTTPGILTLLHARARTLDYPRYAQDTLSKLLVPDPRNVDITPLVEAFDETHDKVLKPWKDMDTCPVRARLDQAAAQVLHMDGKKIADWRKRITKEPTVSGRRTTD